MASESIAQMVTQQLARALQPAITSVTVDWRGATLASDAEGAEKQTIQDDKPQTAKPRSGDVLIDIAPKKPQPPTSVIVRQCPQRVPPIYPGTSTLLHCDVNNVDAVFQAHESSFTVLSTPQIRVLLTSLTLRFGSFLWLFVTILADNYAHVGWHEQHYHSARRYADFDTRQHDSQGLFSLCCLAR